jgi:DNA polymerase-3 subunit epsilon
MRPPAPLLRSSAALTLWVLAWVAALAGALWIDLDAAQRDALVAVLRPRLALVVLIALPLPLLLALVLRRWVRAYPKAALRMREEVLIIGSVNAQHRVSLEGAPELRALGEAINAFAASHQALQDDVQQRIEQANAGLAQQTTRLAALMSELTQGVLVCNREGRILLYNAAASALLEEPGASAEPGAAALVGLNRSIFGLLDKGPIAHALEQAARRLEQQVPHPVTHFVTTRRRGAAAGDEEGGAAASQLLRAQLVPVQDVQDAQGSLSGFVLILEDITHRVDRDSRRDMMLRQLTEGSRASLANLRAAAETLHEHPDIEPALRARFVAAVREEAERLSRQLEDALARGAVDPLAGPWPREDILAADLVLALQRSLESGLGLSSRLEANAGDAAPLWLHLDSHAMVQALTQLVGALAAAAGARELVFELSGQGTPDRFARLGIGWDGAPPDAQRLHEWALQGDRLGANGRPLTLGELLDQHGAEIWSQAGADGRARLCLQLPTTQPGQRAAPALPRSRPVYYDFDLFHQRGQSAALDDTPLAQLSFTVFDTETTGLAPSEGDEIISIGAVRIVNARLLEHECFDRLVKPRRSVRPESQAIHGITPAMLADQLALEQVLPGFARFCEDTVLVAHNAAFDMRFLELARARTGIAFEHPVLDTLLLSSLVHPGHDEREHQLERIALRLGIDVVGRHTALGDAIVTGEVFLKLLPLLAEQGIRTLGQAREASRRSVYTTLAY